MDGKDTNIPRGRRRKVLFAVVIIGAAQALWAADPKIAFDIPASEVSQAIIEFYKQTNVEILYASPGGVGAVKTHAVMGDLEVSEALTRMLEGTGFTFEFENPHSVLLKRVGGESTIVNVASGLSAGTEEFGDGAPKLGEVSSANAPQLQDIVVTGTFIHGVLDIMSPLMRLDRAQMKSTAYATVQDALQTLPGNSQAGPSEDFAGSINNFNKGTGPNLRGLGYGATLVLVNGRRQPFAGVDADFVDTSNIPWSAVERIEVLPDGASALYGSDAIAGVVNIVMRDDLEGAESQGRLASALGGADEKVFSQSFGHRWDTGRAFFTYQYSHRSSLAASDRVYTANADKRSLGGTDHRDYYGNPGTIIDPETFLPVLSIPRGQDGGALKASDLIPGVTNLHNAFELYDLTPERQMHSIYVNANQNIGDRIELYAEARAGRRTAEQRQFELNQPILVTPDNPFFVDAFRGSPYYVAYSLQDDLGAPAYVGETRSYDGTLGIKSNIGRDWHANFFVSAGGEDMRWEEKNFPDFEALSDALNDPDRRTAFNPYGDGRNTSTETLDSIRSKANSRVISNIATASLIADGSVLALPTGDVKLAIGAEQRQERLRHNLYQLPPADYRREISSAFVEFSLPLVGKADEPRHPPRLELSLAGRYERYSDFGNTVNPKIGLRWVPATWVKFRSSWGKSFKAPKLPDLYDTSQNAVVVLPFPDPRSLDGTSLVLIRQGNNPDLNQETATTWTMGFDIAPAAMPGMSLSLTYYSIDYENRVLRPGPTSPYAILYEEDQWADVINRAPSPEQIAEACNSPFLYILSASSCKASSPAALIDFRFRNLALTRTKGVDLHLDYSLATAHGDIALGLMGSHALDFKQALTKTSPSIDVLDTVANPLATRVRGTLRWNQHGTNAPGFNAGAAIDYTGAYRDTGISNYRAIGSLTTLDLSLGYRDGQKGGWLDGVEFAVNAVNVFDKSPPFVDTAYGYDPSNADPFGRVVSFFVQKSW